ncbi:hypothetical protein DFH07DRAFT_1057990 [Mycena maculata]|uniref:Uncharacterized protein n=1 Tax=Mycena maculata TaxID=230809 RepID=A0AAD7JSV3_9AGAR|nr:hypothetical protein DFH07DRAFT_1057990 [Mycena maculata]
MQFVLYTDVQALKRQNIPPRNLYRHTSAMPSNRCPKQSGKYISGEQFALILGLENKPQIFHNCKTAFRRLADRTFNFELPLFQQQRAMCNFVDQVVTHFPGFFNDKHDNNQERLVALQHYARSYLEKSGKLATSKSRKKCPKTRPPTALDTLPSPPPSPVKNDINKVPRPQPRPAYRRKTTTTPVDELTPDAPPVNTEKPKPFPAQGSTRPVSRRNTMPTSIDEPVPDAPPMDIDIDTYPRTPPARRPRRPQTPFHAAPATEEPEEENVPPPGTAGLADFLAGCLPAMGHCESAFHRAGVTEPAHLVGMVHWSEDRLCKFLNRNGIARNPLEEQALVLGFSSLL